MYIKRSLEEDIRNTLNEKEAIFILGSRQVGKTSLMKHIASTLPEKRTYFLDLEDQNSRKILNSGIPEFKAFLDSRELDRSKKCYIFIDEIQYAADFSSTIKYFVDHYSKSYKLIMSGSSAVKIKSGFKESLVGRKYLFELYPLNFSEFCRFKGLNNIADMLETAGLMNFKEDPLRFDAVKLNILIKEFIIYGGYPKVALNDDETLKRRIIKDIAESYILKDIKHLFKLEKLEEFNHLVRFLAIVTGKELNISNLGNEVRLNYRTLLSYIRSLEESYIVSKVEPFHKNKANELRKQPKIYFLDTGLRNYFINNFNQFDFRIDAGELLENYVFSQFKKKSGDFTGIKYWKTSSGAEIDFIIVRDNHVKAYEIKKKFKNKSHLKNFKNIYPSAEISVLSMESDKKSDFVYPLYLV